ncbi:helix-hairpin-helix domain-containing protein [Flavobacteriaceae bacterium 3-367]|uniref:ComEA family DNA-binding protein n=1 Tax=Eudoraea algarum TaxID=3417568 RepID=UPI00328D920E
MKNLRSHFKFNKRERSGIFFLLLLIVVLQCVHFYIKMAAPDTAKSTVVIDADVQRHMDLLKEQEPKLNESRIFPFNPNFISDYKGYSLGMSAVEMDRLLAFRKAGHYVNAPKEFQRVTGISDSLLNKISPYFTFPAQAKRAYSSPRQNGYIIRDLNEVGATELKVVRGIGDKLSLRIVKFRESLGGFMIDEQLYDVYGLQPEVVEETLKRFKVIHRPTIKKININLASVQEIAQLTYIDYSTARKIIAYRELVGSIRSFDELTKIEDFPSDKIDRIKLYLAL